MKRPSRSIKKADWHPEDVKAAVRKTGATLTGLSVAHGFHPSAAGQMLRTPWARMQAIVAKCIGVPPQEIWPSRYHPDGSPHRRGQYDRHPNRIRQPVPAHRQIEEAA